MDYMDFFRSFRFVADPDMASVAAYNASKAAILSMTKSDAIDV